MTYTKSSSSLIPYGRQLITEDDISAVVEVLRGPLITQGSHVPAFEQAISSKVHARYAVAVNSATSALHIACLSLGLKPGDTLWTSPITFVASANCGLYCGSSVDFVDICPETGLMDPALLEKKLIQAKANGKLPKVLVPVHLAGTSCDMKAIADLAKEYNFFVIEDASHAIGGHYSDSMVGSCQYSDITVFSFHPVKIITTGEGGVATTNNPELYSRMQDLRSHGITKDPSKFKLQPAGPWSYEQQLLGYNYRLTDFQAALGLSQLNKLDNITQERNRLFKLYKTLLRNLPVNLLTIPEDVYSSLHLCVLSLRNSNPIIHKKLFMYLRDNGIGVQIHYTPVHLQPFYRNLGFTAGDFPQAEDYATSCMSLPLYPGLLESDITYIVDLLNKFFTSAYDKMSP
jgi:UDP-4-amino-4,6-dideoxy-N-acetyl-beta-L-altrosamine transaminase